MGRIDLPAAHGRWRRRRRRKRRAVRPGRRPRRRRTSDGPASADGGRQADARDLRIRPGGCDRRFQAERSEVVRRQPPVEAAVVSRTVRQGRALLSEPASEPVRRQGRAARRRTATSRRSSSSTCSASATTPARRRFACATPRASGSRSARARRTASSWTWTCSRTSSTTGARTGCCSSATSRSSSSLKDDDKHAGDGRHRSPGASGDGGIYARSHRVAERQAALPGAGLHRATCASAEVGLLPGRAASSATSATTTPLPNDPFDLNGDVTGWGISLSSNVKATDNDILRLQFVYGHGIENYFNDAPVDVGVKSNPGNADDADRRRGAARSSAWCSSRSQLEHKFSTSVGLLARRHQQQRPARPPARTRQASTASSTCSRTPVKNVMMGGEFQWAHARTTSTASSRTTTACSSRSSTASRKVGG